MLKVPEFETLFTCMKISEILYHQNEILIQGCSKKGKRKETQTHNNNLKIIFPDTGLQEVLNKAVESFN